MVADKVTGSAIERYVHTIDRPQGGAPLTIYTVHAWCSRTQRLEVLAELRQRFPGVAVSMIGDEIAVFARDVVGGDNLTLHGSTIVSLA
jgi:hypothetical protein